MIYEFVNEEKNRGMKLYGNILAYRYDNSDDDESDKFDEPAEIIFNGMNIAAWLLKNAHTLHGNVRGPLRDLFEYREDMPR